MLSRSLHESLCCGKIHWQIASWKGNGVFEQPFDDSLFTWYPFIPRFVSINCDINVHSPFSFLISLISSFVLYKFFSIRSIEAYYLFFQLKLSLFQSCYIPNVSEIIFYTISTSSFPIRIQLPLSVDSSVPFLRKISINLASNLPVFNPIPTRDHDRIHKSLTSQRNQACKVVVCVRFTYDTRSQPRSTSAEKNHLPRSRPFHDFSSLRATRIDGPVNSLRETRQIGRNARRKNEPVSVASRLGTRRSRGVEGGRRGFDAFFSSPPPSLSLSLYLYISISLSSRASVNRAIGEMASRCWTLSGNFRSGRKGS